MKANRFRLALLGLVLSAGLNGAALAQQGQQVLVILPDNQGEGESQMRIFWKSSRGAANEDYVVAARQAKRPIPSDYFVGTARPSQGGSLRTWTLHTWRIDRGFMQEAGVTGGLRLTRKRDEVDCPHHKQIGTMAQGYDGRLSTNELLSAILMFGHLYEICKAKGMPASVEAAQLAVERVYRSMNALRSFKGRMCLSGRDNRPCA